MIENILKQAILVPTDVIGLYPCIPNAAEFKVLKNALDARKKYIPTENFWKW